MAPTTAFLILLATLRIASDVFNAADVGQVTVVALLDPSAAFDTVDHDILLRLNISYGVGGTVLRSITSFISNKTQVVNFAGGQSSQTTLTCSVPQGSVSNPILFALNTADFIRTVQSFGV